MTAQKTAINKPDRQDVSGHPKERILQVALELFTKLGYEATSVEDIREAVGFKSKASLYAHFKSKQAISENLTKRILGQIERNSSTQPSVTICCSHANLHSMGIYTPPGVCLSYYSSAGGKDGKGRIRLAERLSAK